MIAAFLFLYGCRHDASVSPGTSHVQNASLDSAMVNVNGADTLKYIQSVLDANYQFHPNDTLINIQVVNHIYNLQLSCALSINRIPLQDGRHIIHKYNEALYNTMSYYDILYETDIIQQEYVPCEDDSTQNYIQMTINKPAKKFSAALNLILVNSHMPYDTVRMRCDTLNSRWQ